MADNSTVLKDYQHSAVSLEVKMKTYLVTGGAGFIGSNYVLYMFEKY